MKNLDDRQENIERVAAERAKKRAEDRQRLKDGLGRVGRAAGAAAKAAEEEEKKKKEAKPELDFSAMIGKKKKKKKKAGADDESTPEATAA